MKKNLFFILIGLFISFTSFAQQHIVSFEVQNKKEISKLPHYLSIDNVQGNIITAYLTEDNLKDFAKLGYNFKEIDHPAKGKVINMATTTSQMANWDKYPTYDVYVQMMQNFATNYPNICKLDTIGVSQNGHLILVVRITDNVNTNETEPEFFYTSTMHGDETTGFVLMLRLVDYLLSNYDSDTEVSNLVNNYDIWINPLANPDGTYHGGDNTVSGSERELANGDDPNRDFPYPLDTNHTTTNPETIAMMNFADAHNFVMSANFHGGSEVYNYPWDCWTSAQNNPPDASWFSHVGTNYVQSARLLNSSYMTSVTSSGVTEGADWYYAYGSRQDYMNYFHHCKEVTIELSSQKILSSDQLPTYWNYNKQSFLDYIKEAIFGFNGTVKNVNGAPLPAKIEIVGHDKDNSEVYTDSVNGDYYRPIAPGTYDVTYSSVGYISQTQTITISDYGVTEINNVTLLQAEQVTLTGTVIDALTAQPIDGATVSLIGTSSESTTDINGEYSISLFEGEYEIKAFKSGYAQQLVTETINSTNNVVDFALLEANAITFEEEIPTNFTYSGDADWVRTTDDAYEGSYSMKSDTITDNQSTSMQFTETTEAGYISFYKKVSSESEYDLLHFYIDGNEKNSWSGEVDWSQESYAITAGSHTFKWTYDKDGSQSSGGDCAWVDYIELPATAATTHTVSFTIKNGSTAEVIEGATVNLTGYGSKITNSSGIATFTDVYETTGTNAISYTVSASGFSNETGVIQVLGDVNQVVNMQVDSGIDELSNYVNVFPNPSDGIFKIETPTNDGQIIIYNTNGAEIFHQSINSTKTKVDLSNKPTGIYLMKFYSNEGVSVQKLILN